MVIIVLINWLLNIIAILKVSSLNQQTTKHTPFYNNLIVLYYERNIQHKHYDNAKIFMKINKTSVLNI